ncbi:MAG: isoprenylcysteine carboxylmethyltransferase family protein [Hyphomicrobiales bacterium]|nr:isoprenylcysteine carboxylmethyltransferase family protein [Hyphomicrobiales bacterium]
MSTASTKSLSGYQHARRAVLFLLLLVAFGALLFIGTYPEEREFHEFMEALGVSLIGVAIIGRLWCTLYIGGRKSSEIVSDGPYSIVRNPLYVFSAIGAAGAGGQTGSAVVALTFGIVTALAFTIVSRREETFLRERFGAAFGAYCARVPRMLPKFSLYRDSATIVVTPKRLYTTFFDSLVFFTAVPVFELVERLQLHGILPVLLRLP